MKVICLLVTGMYQVGDQPPTGYIDKQEWAAIQARNEKGK